jgi:hypothetical protein
MIHIPLTTTTILTASAIVWIPPFVLASIPDVVVKISPNKGLSFVPEDVIEIYTNRASFGSKADVVSGTLVHAPIFDHSLCEHFNEYRRETFPPFPLPQQDTIMLVPRGNCTFERKAYAAKHFYGAVGVLVYDQLGARYRWDDTTQRIIFPEAQLDYECGNGEGVVYNLTLDPPAYNGTILDPLLDMAQTATSICNLTVENGNNDGTNRRQCESQLCVVTSHGENSTAFPVCCAWDLPFAMPASEDANSKETKDIIAVMLTIRQAQQVVITDLLGSQVVIESLRQVFNISYIFLWMLGCLV